MSYTEEELRDTWRRALPIPGKDPDLYRTDQNGNEIFWHSYGKYSRLGWQVHHVDPLALGGADVPGNRVPLKSEVNASLGGKLGATLSNR